MNAGAHRLVLDRVGVLARQKQVFEVPLPAGQVGSVGRNQTLAPCLVEHVLDSAAHPLGRRKLLAPKRLQNLQDVLGPELVDRYLLDRGRVVDARRLAPWFIMQPALGFGFAAARWAFSCRPQSQARGGRLLTAGKNEGDVMISPQRLVQGEC
jgi:hypothetical protein